ncbi:hypothetical protein NKI66_02890 [Mesorhizobium sp. M0518]|uniref:hypothetical protein n=1 Tax=Mesorhizobium sp. M0518 TaxID=2956956 RepID=UPI0033385512
MAKNSDDNKVGKRSGKEPEADARGQSEKHHKGGKNNGVSSANPRILSGEKDGDATFPLKRKSDSSVIPALTKPNHDYGSATNRLRPARHGYSHGEIPAERTSLSDASLPNVVGQQGIDRAKHGLRL